MSDADFKHHVAEHFFASEKNTQAEQLATDLLEFERIWSFESEWYWPSPMIDPAFFIERAKRASWSKVKLAEYDRHLATLRRIASRDEHSNSASAKEMSALASTVVQRWDKSSATPSQEAAHREATR